MLLHCEISSSDDRHAEHEIAIVEEIHPGHLLQPRVSLVYDIEAHRKMKRASVDLRYDASRLLVRILGKTPQIQTVDQQAVRKKF